MKSHLFFPMKSYTSPQFFFISHQYSRKLCLKYSPRVKLNCIYRALNSVWVNSLITEDTGATRLKRIFFTIFTIVPVHSSIKLVKVDQFLHRGQSLNDIQFRLNMTSKKKNGPKMELENRRKWENPTEVAAL